MVHIQKTRISSAIALIEYPPPDKHHSEFQVITNCLLLHGITKSMSNTQQPASRIDNMRWLRPYTSPCAPCAVHVPAGACISIESTCRCVWARAHIMNIGYSLPNLRVCVRAFVRVYAWAYPLYIVLSIVCHRIGRAYGLLTICCG